MSATVDANILVYASNRSDPAHEPARSLIKRLAEGPDLMYLFWPVAMGYLRVVTHPAILPHPMSPAAASGNIERLVTRPNVRTAGELDDFWKVFSSTGAVRPRGNEVPDTHLVALMRQHGVRILYTRDRGFRRFDGIDVIDPIE